MGLFMSRKEFAARQEEFPPDRFDFFWNDDFSEVEVVQLAWWDDASYREWQGDRLGGLPPIETSGEDADA